MLDNAARTIRQGQAWIVRAMLLPGSRILRGKESLLNGPDLACKI